MSNRHYQRQKLSLEQHVTGHLQTSIFGFGKELCDHKVTEIHGKLLCLL